MLTLYAYDLKEALEGIRLEGIREVMEDVAGITAGIFILSGIISLTIGLFTMIMMTNRPGGPRTLIIGALMLVAGLGYIGFKIFRQKSTEGANSQTSASTSPSPSITPSATASPTTTTHESINISWGTIGIVVGGIIVAFIIYMVLIHYYIKMRNKRKETKRQREETERRRRKNRDIWNEALAHEKAILDTWREYRSTAKMVLTYPSLSKLDDPITQEAADQMLITRRLRAKEPQNIDADPSTYAYVKAVDELDRRFHRAVRAAEKRNAFTHKERTLIDQALIALQVIRTTTNEAEESLNKHKLKRVLKQLDLDMPRAAMLDIETNYRLQLTTGTVDDQDESMDLTGLPSTDSMPKVPTHRMLTR